MKKEILVLLLILLGIIIIPLPTYADISDGLMAYYPFDGNSNDISGNGNHGTEFGGLTYKMGLSGESANFDGIDDYIRIASHSSLNPIDQLTISFWMKVDGYTNIWSPIVHKGGPYESSSFTNREYTVWLYETSSLLLASAGDNSAQHYQYASGAGLGIWTHFTAVIDRQNHFIKIYVNGALALEVSDSYSSFNNNDSDLIIGWTEETHSSVSPFKGQIDELRIHNRALSESEISDVFNEYSSVAFPLTTILAESTFSQGIENWSGYSPEISWRSSGGNPDGYLRWADSGSPSKSLSAPAKFLGDWTALNEVGFISFDQRILSTGSYNSRGYRRVGISGPGGSAAWYGPRAPASSSYPTFSWTTFKIPLKEKYWTVTSGSWDELLMDVTAFSVSPELYGNTWGQEITGLDNVVLETADVSLVNGLGGESIQTKDRYEVVLEQYAQAELNIQLANQSDEAQSVSLAILNPNDGISISVSPTNPISLDAGESIEIPLVIDAGTMSTGAYDDILLKVTTDDGETLYSNITITIVESGAENLPNLSVTAEDIELSDYTLGDTATLTAVVRNQGLAAASDVTVQFYELGALLGEAILTEVAAEGSGTATITIPIGTSEGDHLIQLVVDPSDEIAELDESNNEASKIVTWGTPSTTVGNILVTGSSPSTVYAGDLFSVSGKAVYDVYVDGVRYTEYVVKGGSVQITVKDNSGNEWIYGGIHTDINGNFKKYLQAPETLDAYQLSMTVTDKTFTGTRELVFQVVEKPTTPQEPPAPPTVTGSGYWSYEPSAGSWIWTWTSPPLNESITQTDLRVFSKDIYFSNNNPDPNEDITFFADILYWATSTNVVAENVPINFYVTYPGESKEKIGSTIIPSLSVGNPDFGSRYVYGTWKNQGEGIYIFEVAIDPSYTEENMLNNAATRAIIVGEIESYQGIIQGQVTNAWGAVADAIIELYDSSMTTLIASTLTDTNGHYLFDSVPVGDYQVHIVTPDEYEADAETKPTEVVDQEISVVDFFLTKIESLCGDLDHDGDVDGTDRNILRAAFGTVEGDAGFILEADYDEDGNIDYSDYQLWYYCYKQYIVGL